MRVTALLRGHRREIGARKGRRAGSEHASIRILAAAATRPISTSYHYLRAAIDVLTEQAPDLQEVLDRAKR